MPFEPGFIEHRERRVLYLDFRELEGDALLAAFDRAAAIIRSQPPASLRILTLLGARFNANGARAFQRYALGNGPYVLASAVVVSRFWYVVVASLRLNGRRDLRLFSHEAEALDWVATQ